MSLSELPDVALIKIFRTLDHFELVHFYHSCDVSQRLQTLIRTSSCLWTHIHIKSTVDYHLFVYFVRLLIHNAHVIRRLIIDQLDATCRTLLNDNGFSFDRFVILEELVVHDEHLCNTAQAIRHCSSPFLRILRLTHEHAQNLNLSHLSQLTSLQMTLYSIGILRTSFEYLTDLHLKVMFEHGHNARDIFPLLPRRCLQSFTLHFLLLNSDVNFRNELRSYQIACYHLRRFELHYLHGICPTPVHADIDFSKLDRLILVNMCQLIEMKTFVEMNQLDLPIDYLQLNTATIMPNSHSSYIQIEQWHRNEIISLDYIQCVTTSMELLQEQNIIWSDKLHMSQSFEAYALRSIYNASNLICSLRTLSIGRIELSLNGLEILLTSLNQLIELTMTDGKIDQMGSGMCDIDKIIRTTTTTNVSQSNIQILVLNNIQMSHRTTVKLCLITHQLIVLTMTDVRLLNKNQNHHSNFLLFLKQIASSTNQFRWNQLKSLTLGKNMINRQNLLSFIGSKMSRTYSPYINHLRIVIADPNLLEPRQIFLKSMKKLVRCHPKLTSFIVEFLKRQEIHVRLRNELQSILELCTTGKVLVYPTVHDRAYRFCFDTNNDNESDDEYFSPTNFCGIPLFRSSKKQRTSSSVFFCT